jgi:hypothetical protein
MRAIRVVCSAWFGALCLLIPTRFLGSSHRPSIRALHDRLPFCLIPNRCPRPRARTRNECNKYSGLETAMVRVNRTSWNAGYVLRTTMDRFCHFAGVQTSENRSSGARSARPRKTSDHSEHRTMKLRHPAGDIRTQWSSRKRCASSGLSVAPGWAALVCLFFHSA